MRLVGIRSVVLLTMLAASTKGAVPVIEPTPRVETDGLSLLKPAEATALGAGLKFKLAYDHAVVEGFDQRNPNRDKPLDSILKVDQIGFVRAINVRTLGTHGTGCLATLDGV